MIHLPKYRNCLIWAEYSILCLEVCHPGFHFSIQWQLPTSLTLTCLILHVSADKVTILSSMSHCLVTTLDQHKLQPSFRRILSDHLWFIFQKSAGIIKMQNSEIGGDRRPLSGTLDIGLCFLSHKFQHAVVRQKHSFPESFLLVFKISLFVI